MFEVIFTELYNEQVRKLLSPQFQRDIYVRIQKLREHPYSGKPLGAVHFREMKLQKFRVFYFVYPDERIVLVMAVSDKKHQQETIALIRKNSETFRHFIEKYIKSEERG